MSRLPSQTSTRWTPLALLAGAALAAALAVALPRPVRAQPLRFVSYTETTTSFMLTVRWTGNPGNNELTVGKQPGYPTTFWTPRVTLMDLGDTDGDYGGFRFCATHVVGPHHVAPPLDVDPNDAGCLFLRDPDAAGLGKTIGAAYVDVPDAGTTLGRTKDHPTTGTAIHVDTTFVQYRRAAAGGAVDFRYFGEHLGAHGDALTLPEPATARLLEAGVLVLGGVAGSRRRRRAA